MENKCGDCRFFDGMINSCINSKSRLKNKDNKTKESKACGWFTNETEKELKEKFTERDIKIINNLLHKFEIDYPNKLNLARAKAIRVLLTYYKK